MQKKKTDELLKDLKKDPNLDHYFAENEGQFVDRGIGAYLDAIVAERKLKKNRILKAAEMNELYGYQIFSGSRKPSRDKLIALCIGMGLSEEEINGALKYAGDAPLYPRSKRDSIILAGILQGSSVMEINGQLYERGFETL